MYDVRVIPGPPLPLSALNLQNTQGRMTHGKKGKLFGR